ncbi:MAG: PilZ domain-containing protein [Hyphomicrobiaceae bacterium]
MDYASDQRKYGRRAVAMRATIEVLGRSHISCIIHNLSDGGALIELIDKAVLPRSFGLRLHNSNATIDCELTHRTGTAFGVAFKPQDGIVGAAVKRAIRNTQEALKG